jgi:Domain of unknown function (DUF4150)
VSNQVYANNMEVSCKAAAGKSICAFPDVCMTPPMTPATPPGVPIPYPNTGMASDTSDGSSSVKISGQEVMLKNKSYFKKSMGDEAGCAPKKGVVTSKNMGKVYFRAWSMDVKVEGENVVRHLDMTTHNHASEGPNTPPMVHIDEISIVFPELCRDTVEQCDSACSKPGGMSSTGSGSGRTVTSCSDDCRNAQKCLLVPKKHDTAFCCPEAIPPGVKVRSNDTLRTGHHLIEDQFVKGNPNFPWYSTSRGPVPSDVSVPAALPGRDAGSDPPSGGVDDAPTVCTNSFPDPGTPHQGMHHVQGVHLEQFQTGGPRATSAPSNGYTYGKAKEACLRAHGTEFPDSKCDRTCMEAQLDSFYGADNDRPMNLPSRQQGLAGSRDVLHDAWGNVHTEAQGLTQNLGSILKAAGF